MRRKGATNLQLEPYIRNLNILEEELNLLGNFLEVLEEINSLRRRGTFYTKNDFLRETTRLKEIRDNLYEQLIRLPDASGPVIGVVERRRENGGRGNGAFRTENAAREALTRQNAQLIGNQPDLPIEVPEVMATNPGVTLEEARPLNNNQDRLIRNLIDQGNTIDQAARIVHTRGVGTAATGPPAGPPGLPGPPAGPPGPPAAVHRKNGRLVAAAERANHFKGIPFLELLGAPNARGYYNYTMCPCCLNLVNVVGFGEGEQGACQYHHHICPKNMRNEELWIKYTDRHEMYFCSTCGRACSSGHSHYILTPNPRLPPTGEVVRGGSINACAGGGRPEFIARIQAVIDILNTYEGGDLEMNQEFITRCSDAAESASMDTRRLREAQTIIQNRMYARPVVPGLYYTPTVAEVEPSWIPEWLRMGITEGPGWLLSGVTRGIELACSILPRRAAAAAAVAPAPAAAAAAAPAPAARVEAVPECPPGHHVPEVILAANRGTLRCYYCEAVMEDEIRDLYRFRHPSGNRGVGVYTHPDTQLICRDHLAEHITRHTEPDNFNPYCFTPAREGCGAIIHRCELGMIQANNPALYQRYIDSHHRDHQIGGYYKRRKNTRVKKTRRSTRKRHTRGRRPV